jgi:hypothetical protein
MLQDGVNAVPVILEAPADRDVGIERAGANVVI